MKILVMSDTHIPRSSHDFPQEVYDQIKNVDMIIHAGDMVEKEVYDKLSSLRPTKAVLGNMDSMKLREVLNEKEILDMDGVKIGIIHGYGAPINILETVKKEFKGVNAIIFGHTHKPVNEIRDGVLYFNPGSPTDTVFAPYMSYGLLDINKGKIKGEIVKIK
jgi:putative phosphoesterase